MLSKITRWQILFLGSTPLFLSLVVTFAFAKSSNEAKVYLIGNSLTWDTLPSRLDGEIEWHVDCGKNLKYIYENPQQPCVKSSVLWPNALKSTQYDVLCVQPHFGTTLTEDLETISKWLELQPEANLIVHTGWNRSEEFESVYYATIDHDRMVHNPVYFEKLLSALRERFPKREITSTRAIQMLDSVLQDIKNGQAPFNELSDIFRDDIHLGQRTGRYLAHNLMRIALKMPLSDDGFQLEPTVQKYFDLKLEEFENETSLEKDSEVKRPKS